MIMKKKSFPVPLMPLLLDFFLCLYEGDCLDQEMRCTPWFLSAEQTGRRGKNGLVLFDPHTRGGILCTS